MIVEFEKCDWCGKKIISPCVGYSVKSSDDPDFITYTEDSICGECYDRRNGRITYKFNREEK